MLESNALTIAGAGSETKPPKTQFGRGPRLQVIRCAIRLPDNWATSNHVIFRIVSPARVIALFAACSYSGPYAHPLDYLSFMRVLLGRRACNLGAGETNQKALTRACDYE